MGRLVVRGLLGSWRPVVVFSVLVGLVSSFGDPLGLSVPFVAAWCVAEVVAVRRWPKARAFTVFVATWHAWAEAWARYVARLRGNGLLRMAGLVTDKEDEEPVDYPAYVHVGREGAATWAELPLLPGVFADRVQKACEGVAHVYGGSAVQVQPRGSAGFLVRWLRPETFPALVRYPPTADVSVDAVPVGVDGQGKLVTVQPRESNILCAGLPGAGKSGFLNALLAGVSRRPDIMLYAIDPKRVELKPWANMAQRIVSDEEDFAPFLDELNTLMDRRYEELASSGARKVTDFNVTPLLLLVVDELAELTATGDSKRDKAVSAGLRRLVQKGRAAGICVVAATQRPSSDVVPTSLRDLFVQRVAFATSTVEMSAMILGDYAADDSGAKVGPHEIAPSEKGVGYMMAASDRQPRKFKAFWVADEQIPQIVGAAHRRVSA